MRRELGGVLIVVVCGFGAGCCCTHKPSDGWGPPGPVAITNTTRDVGADLFTSSMLPEDSAVSSVSGDSTLVTIAQGNVNYSVLLGGCDDGIVNNGIGTGQVVANSDPAWDMEQGYVVAWGWRPYVTTTQVVTGSDGTTVLVQIENKGLPTETHRVYLIRGGPTRVQAKAMTDACNVTNEKVTLTKPMTFVECRIDSTGGCYDLSGIKSLSTPSNTHLRRFVREALDARRAQTLVPE